MALVLLLKEPVDFYEDSRLLSFGSVAVVSMINYDK
jgi:hypothetical protein